MIVMPTLLVTCNDRIRSADPHEYLDHRAGVRVGQSSEPHRSVILRRPFCKVPVGVEADLMLYRT